MAQAADLDIAPLFSGYESGCDLSGAVAEKLDNWAIPNEKGGLASADVLPPILRNHIGKPKIANKSDHWFVQVPLHGVHFKGLPVTRFERWSGKNNGISGWALGLAVPVTKARRSINVKNFKVDEQGIYKPELIADKAGRGTSLVCDYSM
jgi:hypothetical protein